MGEIYRSAFTQNNLISGLVTTVAGQYIKLGEYKVPAGELVAMGHGDQSGQDTAVGRIYAIFKNASSVVQKGKVRFSIYSPQDRPLTILHEFRTETLDSGASDRSLQIPLPENSVWASEDKKLVLEFMADTTGAVDKATSSLIMDITLEAV